MSRTDIAVEGSCSSWEMDAGREAAGVFEAKGYSTTIEELAFPLASNVRVIPNRFSRETLP